MPEKSDSFESLWCDTAKEWRAWLEQHSSSARELWLEFLRAPIRKKRALEHQGPSYQDALDEALCFGWIDISVKKIDDERYAQKFVPRKNPLKWTATNIARFKYMESQGKMTARGRAAISPELLED